MSQRTPDADPGADLDEAVSEVTRGIVQKAVLGATLLADHRRRQTDQHAGELSRAASEERQRAAMDVLRARTGYAHAADAGWVDRASESELAEAWVSAEPWRESDEVAARVHQLIGRRLERDWPTLASEYAQGLDDGLGPADAMRRASRTALTGDDEAVQRLDSDWPELADEYARAVDAGRPSSTAMHHATLAALGDARDETAPANGDDVDTTTEVEMSATVGTEPPLIAGGGGQDDPGDNLLSTGTVTANDNGTVPAGADGAATSGGRGGTTPDSADAVGASDGAAGSPVDRANGPRGVKTIADGVPIVDDGVTQPLPAEPALIPESMHRGEVNSHRVAADDLSAPSRLLRDWPSLPGYYVQAIDDGLEPADALRRASLETLGAAVAGKLDNGALMEAGIAQEKNAQRWLDTHDDATALAVDERQEAVEAFVAETQRGRDLQAQATGAQPSGPVTRSRFAPPPESAPAATRRSAETTTRSRD